MSTEQNKDIVRRFHEAVVNNRDLDAAQQYVSPNVKAYMPGMPDPLDLAGFKQMGAMFLAAFPDMKQTVDEICAEGDLVATSGTYWGTHQGEFQGIAPTGIKVKMTWLGFDRVVNGKIVEHRWEQDNMALLQQLGAIPMERQTGK